MSSIKKILIGLDFTSMDEELLSYVDKLSSYAKPEEVVLLSVHEEIGLPESIANKFPELVDSIDATLVQKLKDETANYTFNGAKTTFEALQGNILVTMLEYVAANGIDLIVIGKKTGDNQKGIAHRSLLRKAQCNVAIVPQGAKAEFENVMVASDFSEYSGLATKTAIDITGGLSKTTCYHEFRVPKGYSKTGKSYEEFEAIMRKHATEDYNTFIERNGLGSLNLTPVLTCNDDKDVGESIVHHAQNNDIDLVVIGAKGRSAVAALFLGSVAEEIIEQNLQVPTLIVKDVSREFDIWDAIQKM